MLARWFTLLVLPMMFCGCLSGQPLTVAPQTQTLSLPEQSISRSQTFHLATGESIVVTGSSQDRRFNIDLYVYDVHQVLVGKDDDDVASPSFEWQCPSEGDYYVLARNLSDATGSLTIETSSTRSVAIPPIAALAQVRVFYATDRGATGQTDPTLFYGSEPGKDALLHLGEALVSIPRDHRMGELEGPSIFKLEFRQDPQKHVVLQTVSDEPENAFLQHLSSRIAHSRLKEVLVFIHGFNTTFSDAVRRTAQITYDLGFDGPAILYSWPSQGEPTLFAYNKDVRNADLTAARLMNFLKLIEMQTGAKTIHVIAHSMGNRPLTTALLAQANSAPSPSSATLDQVILMAPDIDAALFKQMAGRLRPGAHRLTLYASSKDEALKLSQSYAGYTRAGEAGANILVVPGVDTIDASAVDTNAMGFYHQYYADNTTILGDVFHVLQGDLVSRRFGLVMVPTGSGAYWQFRGAIR